MSCTCNNGYVTIATGNSFLMKLHLAQWDPAVNQNVEYPMDGAQNVAVRFIGNNGKCIKYTDISIDGNTLTFLVDGARLIPAKYSIEIKFTMDGLNKRAYRCGLLNVVKCGQCINNALNEECEIDIIFNEDNEIINIGGVVWAHVDSALDKSSENPVQNKVITKALDDYATKDYVLEVVSGGEIDTDDFVKDDELTEILSSYVKNDDLNETLSSYVTSQQMQEAIESIPETDLSDYYTKNQVDALIENIDIPDIDTTSYVTRQELAENNFAYASDVADLTEELIADEQVIATHAHKIHDLESYFPSYATIEYVNSVVAGGDIDLSAYVTKQELDDANFAYYKDFNDYVRLEQFNETKSYIIDELIKDELVLARAANDITKLNTYFRSYVPYDEYYNLYNSYNSLYLTLSYMMDNVSWTGASASPEQYTFGYIIGHASKGFSTRGCEAFPITYFSAPMFKVWVADGTLTGSCEAMFMDAGDGNNYELSDIISFNVDTSGVTSMKDMFYYCQLMTAVDLSHFDTRNVTDMSRMFMACRQLRQLDLSSFDTSNVTDMSRMFIYCWSLPSLDLSGFNTSNVAYMNNMFLDCRFLKTLDISNFDLTNVVRMRGMFSKCGNLSTIYVDNMTDEHINMIKSQLETDTGHAFTLATVDGRKALKYN